jgi:hypothetical protein
MKNIKAIALFCMVGLILSGCKNPFINSILNKANKDEEDFGPGASIIVLNVGSTGDWTGVAATINTSVNDRNYVINVTGDFGTSTALNSSATGIRVSIRGNYTITHNIASRLIRVPPSQTYILRSPLKGQVECNGGELIMREGASISGVFESNGGVSVNGGGGIFNMYGGTISGNHAASTGGGVYINGATFNMYGGKISGNLANGYGGGVMYAGGGTFNKIGGTIYGNDAGENSNRAAIGTGHAAYNGSGPVYFDYTLGPRVSGFVRW